jgi:hypothetical protein
MCFVFSATGASAVRLSQLHQLGAMDVSFTSVSSLNWSVIEVFAGIVCACVPSLKPLIKRLFPASWLTTFSTSAVHPEDSLSNQLTASSWSQVGAETKPRTFVFESRPSRHTIAMTEAQKEGGEPLRSGFYKQFRDSRFSNISASRIGVAV